MDYSLFDDAKCISMIYKEKMPDLQDVEIVKMEIEPGEDAEILITFDITELPRELPSKWLLKGVNTIQIEIAFIGIEFIKFNLTNGCKCSLALESKDGRKYACFRNNIDDKEISLEAKWILAKYISAYFKNTSDPAE